MAETVTELDTRIKAALNNKEIPNINFNGFVNQIGPGDILIILERNQQPVAVINTSFTVAKTLAQKLGGLIANLEDATGNTIMTTDDIDRKLSEARK